LGLDADQNGRLQWRELLAQQSAIDDFIRSKLRFTRADTDCVLAIDPASMIDEHFNEGYIVLSLRAQCALAGVFAIHYDAFFDRDSEHKLIAELTTDDLHHTLILSDNQRIQTVNLAQSQIGSTFIAFVYQGIVHIWQGLDHILFLFSLLLTCVMTRNNGNWEGHTNSRQIISKAAWVVSAFTLAHSITLSLTALGILQLPSRWVEVAIALSVVFTAMNNIVPIIKPIAALTLVFGFVHGMGFAGVLGELGLPADRQLFTILAFNIGVELGQLAIVLAVLPVLFSVRKRLWYARFGLKGASAGISLIALYWVIERI
jgi:hypothetical protein